MTEILEHVAKMDMQGILALSLLVVIAAGYKTLDWCIKTRLEAKKADKDDARRERRTRELSNSLAVNLEAQRRLHTESHEQLLVMFREDRAALAASLVETLDGIGTFGEADRVKLTKVHNAHLGDGARRTDGTLRWHGSEVAEQAVIEARDGTRKLLDMATEQRDATKEQVRLLARLEARAP